MLAYTRREALRRDTRITLIKTTPEQDKRILQILNNYTSKSGYIDNCARRTMNALDALHQDLDIINQTLITKSATLPLEVEQNSIKYMNFFGGNRYTINKINSKQVADNLQLKTDFKIFDNIYGKF